MESIVRAGVDVVRLNFSHGDPGDHISRVDEIRKCAERVGRHVGVLADLQGPKIRIDCFKDKKVFLKEGATFILDANLDPKGGTQERVGIAYKDLPDDVNSGDTLLLDDGRIVLSVDRTEEKQIICRVTMGGELSDRKGINRQGGGLSAPALTDKDREDIKDAAAFQADYVAISGVLLSWLVAAST